MQSVSKLKNHLMNNSKDSMIFAENGEQFKALLQEVLENKDNLSLGIGGGGAYGITTYMILDYLLKQGIKPKEVVGNSVGSIIAAMIAIGNTDLKYIEYFLAGLDQKFKPSQIVHIVVAKLSPFFCEFTLDGKELNIKDLALEHSHEFVQETLKITKSCLLPEGQVDEVVLGYIVKNFWQAVYGEELKGELRVRKINFNDVKNISKEKYEMEEGMHLSMYASAVTGLKPISGIVKSLKDKLSFKKGEIKVEEDEKDKKENKLNNFLTKNQILRPVLFGGSFPVLDAILYSTGAFGIIKGKVKGKRFWFTDGMMSGKQFPNEDGDYRFNGMDEDRPKSKKVMIHTENAAPRNSVLLKGFGNADYVISPNVDDEAWYKLTDENLQSLVMVAEEMIGEKSGNVQF